RDARRGSLGGCVPVRAAAVELHYSVGALYERDCPVHLYARHLEHAAGHCDWNDGHVLPSLPGRSEQIRHWLYLHAQRDCVVLGSYRPDWNGDDLVYVRPELELDDRQLDGHSVPRPGCRALERYRLERTVQRGPRLALRSTRGRQRLAVRQRQRRDE